MPRPLRRGRDALGGALGVDRALLRPDEVAWLDDYHAEVRRRLLPLLDDEADRQWLTEATRPLHDE